jgi:hypothetical protein
VATKAKSTETAELRESYIDLLKRTLRNEMYRTPNPPSKVDLLNMEAQKMRLRWEFRQRKDALAAINGIGRHELYWMLEGNRVPAHTLASAASLDNVHSCVEDALENDIPGDLIETGVYRGGQTILMRGILKAWNETERKVFVADSFEGLPDPDADQDLDDAIAHAFLTQIDRFAVSEVTVKETFANYGLDDDQVVILKGWFADTLPTAPIDQLAVVRLDGDYYDSTVDSITNLYPKLSKGGWIIIDDYGLPLGCRRAIDEYRDEHVIDDPIQMADDQTAYWQRTS